MTPTNQPEVWVTNTELVQIAGASRVSELLPWIKELEQRHGIDVPRKPGGYRELGAFVRLIEAEEASHE